ncbi:MAG: hypothetical protein V1494_01525 [Candidatus Diapherotrites archaeon]
MTETYKPVNFIKLFAYLLIVALIVPLGFAILKLIFILFGFQSAELLLEPLFLNTLGGVLGGVIAFLVTKEFVK